ncbi:DEAD/DEAH box helicase, partial [Aquimarina celericrescens]|nr:DEAD/DEAH box helicase [Aquimarina celericrescens]
MSKAFSALGVSNALLESLAQLHISMPTAIQEKAIPAILTTQEDVVVLAKTGAGKTLTFALPLLQLIDDQSKKVQGLVLVPTRELGQQILQQLASFAQTNSNINIVDLFGGKPIKPQLEELKTNPQLLVATPGRLLDIIKKGALSLKDIAYLVLDEADELLNGLKEEVGHILKATPQQRRTLLFTATTTGALQQFIHNNLKNNVLYIEAEMATKGHQAIDH